MPVYNYYIMPAAAAGTLTHCYSKIVRLLQLLDCLLLLVVVCFLLCCGVVLQCCLSSHDGVKLIISQTRVAATHTTTRYRTIYMRSQNTHTMCACMHLIIIRHKIYNKPFYVNKDIILTLLHVLTCTHTCMHALTYTITYKHACTHTCIPQMHASYQHNVMKTEQFTHSVLLARTCRVVLLPAPSSTCSTPSHFTPLQTLSFSFFSLSSRSRIDLSNRLLQNFS